MKSEWSDPAGKVGHTNEALQQLSTSTLNIPTSYLVHRKCGKVSFPGFIYCEIKADLKVFKIHNRLLVLGYRLRVLFSLIYAIFTC